ncbi:hypothetical protein AWL63_23670 (plasmid) [Sphingomonas panacis]|uniref:HTH marR-type domain-containing protein n=1 Tax=Sphingomonas panacis TaxID=1560345 RepID=A0A1B3ZIC0_9SPHN|nr:MarR family winged helix-turn-helix transcriptional regulator [Sphingomonas panacis]AOH87170.1 hypothetical protein AWL63_23670 [Sphingomonas panacis]
MEDPDSHRIPCVFETLRKASRAFARLGDQTLAPCGMTAVQFTILRSIENRGPDGWPLSKLAETMLMERTTLYRALSPMKRAGWIEISNPNAGRVKVVAATAGGRLAFERANALWAQAQARILTAFGTDRWRVLSGDLTDLTGFSTRLGD